MNVAVIGGRTPGAIPQKSILVALIQRPNKFYRFVE